MKRCHAHEYGSQTSLTVLASHGGSMHMPAIAFVLLGFVAAVFVMTIINLYKYLIKIMSQ
ncbi:MAG TPA: hypothetical protein VMT57_02590 [Candidatus Thermoplasmatota archaeon]|nr:hypothetical protein [Candidatus Thermoplasmatota archaeon]